MFQVISARLARLARCARDRRLLREQHVAAVNGWQVQRVAPGTYRFRDPRFDRLRAPAEAGGGRHG